jgi:hypothetical protein
MPDRVLLLESDPMRQVGFRAALAAAGYTGVAVSDPEDAVGLLGTGPFHLILLGPGERAEAARPLQAAPERPPIVALAELPDCVIGQALPGEKPPRDLPAILEALTRYVRFAPPRGQETQAEYEKLLHEWTEYDERAG